MLTQKIDWPLGNGIQTMISQKYSPPWPTDSFSARESISVSIVGLHQQRTVRCRYNVLPCFQGIFTRAPESCVTIRTLYWCHYPDTETEELRALIIYLLCGGRAETKQVLATALLRVQRTSLSSSVSLFRGVAKPSKIGKDMQKEGRPFAPGFPIDLSSPDAKSVKKRRLAF